MRRVTGSEQAQPVDGARWDYLTNGPRTIPAVLVAQTATAIQFKLPEEAVSGVWTVGRRRPFEWTLVLETADGTLLTYTAFTIATD